ncbi:MAG: hypothetical protein ACI9D5_000919, partial [Candidatus Endobugula sp.]
MTNSMTGFARRELQATWGTLSCEMRSVNHRYLEPLIRLPESLRSLETVARELCRKHLQRGKIEVNVYLNVHSAQAESLHINHALVEQLTNAVSQLGQAVSKKDILVAPIDPLCLLQWPGVVEQQGVDTDAIAVATKTLLAETLAVLIEHRQREGVELRAHIEQRLVSIGDYVKRVREQMPSILASQKDKLQQRLRDLQVEVEQERFAQEVAILANKADVDEELDRLSTHIEEVKHILAQKGAIGRRLDFMMQELNREANTLSSKAIHTDTTQA